MAKQNALDRVLAAIRSTKQPEHKDLIEVKKLGAPWLRDHLSADEYSKLVYWLKQEDDRFGS